MKLFLTFASLVMALTGCKDKEKKQAEHPVFPAQVANDTLENPTAGQVPGQNEAPQGRMAGQPGQMAPQGDMGKGVPVAPQTAPGMQ